MYYYGIGAEDPFAFVDAVTTEAAQQVTAPTPPTPPTPPPTTPTPPKAGMPWWVWAGVALGGVVLLKGKKKKKKKKSRSGSVMKYRRVKRNPRSAKWAAIFRWKKGWYYSPNASGSRIYGPYATRRAAENASRRAGYAALRTRIFDDKR